MNPKFALIPAGYKASVLYQQLPRSDYFDFDRSTVATQINKEGYLEEAAIDIPRVSYDLSANGIPSTCPSLLLEPVSTNLITYSEDFSNAAWTKGNSTITLNSTTSPEGLVNASKLTEDTATSSHRVEETVTVSSGATVTCSVYAKKGERNFLLLFESNSTDGAYFNLDTGKFVKVDGTPVDYNIQDLKNGWYRCSIVVTVPSTSCRFQIYMTQTSSTSSYTGDGSSSIFIYGAQVEELSYVTSYIPTSGATVTRAAETCDDAGNASTFNSEQGILYTEIAALADSITNRGISISSGSSANRVIIYYTNVSNGVQYNVIVGSVNQASGYVVISDITNFAKIAIKFKANSFALWINGSSVLTDTSGSTFPANTLDRINFDSATGAEVFYGKCKDLRYYDTQGMTDAEITELLTTLTQ